jgi:hypothetical protein
MAVIIGLFNRLNRIIVAGIKSLVESWLSLPGETGDYASIPDSAPLSIPGDMEIEVDAAADDWTPVGTENLVSKYQTSGQASYRMMVLAGGSLWWQHSADGTNSAWSTGPGVNMSTIVNDGDRVKLKVTIDVDNGAGDAELKFWYRFSDGDSWTQLGSTQTLGATTSIFDGTEQVSIGQRSNVEMFAGKIYRAIIRDGIDGTVELDANFAAEAPGTTSFTESSSNAATVTINQSGDPQAEIVNE